MKAIILAAGIGSRLQPMTSNKPKCLIEVAGRPILDYQIRSYASAGIKDIIIIVGYKSEQVIDFCRHIEGVNIKTIENTNYEVTNNMYSLYLAFDDLVGKTFVLSNGDVIFDEQIACSIVHSEIKDLIATDHGKYLEESMKITVNHMGLVDNISKTIPSQLAYGNSIDLYKFSAESSEIFFMQIKDIIEKDGNLNDWTEVALQKLLRTRRLSMRPFDIAKRRWVEIDNYEDLALADKLFSDFDRSLKNKKLFFIDLDGTIYIGDKIIQGAKEFLVGLESLGIDFYFLSNNSSRSKKDYVKKLNRMGIITKEEKIILSTDGLIEYLLNEKVKDVFVVGTKSMESSLIQKGMNTKSDKPEFVVLGFDTELSYEKIRQASLHLENGVDLLATHCDVVCPTSEGNIPDIGSMLALFEVATGKKPVKIFGKPNLEMVYHVMACRRIKRKDTVVVGDRLYTDMELARRIGCDFICVLSGETRREDCDNDRPDLIVKDVSKIIHFGGLYHLRAK